MKAQRSSPVVAEVREHNGAPALFIDGQAGNGLAYYAPNFTSEAAGKRQREFAAADVHLFSVSYNLGPLAGQPAPHDFAGFDRKIAAIVASDPAALVLPRVEITLNRDWVQDHPDDAMLHFYPASGALSVEGMGNGNSFTSPRWREVMDPLLAAFVRHAEERCGHIVAGYHLGAGAAQEWAYLWGNGVSDFSVVHQAAFRAWLRARYRDEPALRAAWKQPDLTFETVAVPRDRAQPPNEGWLVDPARHRSLVDYLTFHSEAVADAILHFSGVTKYALADLGRRKLCGAFYGYYFWDAGYPYCFQNCGHHALQRLLNSEHIDFLSGPYSYQERFHGGMFQAMLPADSVRLHGKLLYNEDDTRTHLVTEAASLAARCPDVETTAGVLKRNVVGSLATGATLWWMDIAGSGWFEDPALMNEISAMVRLADGHLAGCRSPRAQIAVIVSEETSRYVWSGCELTDALIARQLSELTAMGAPFRTYLAGDLERIFAGPEGAGIQLVIFMNCAYLAPDQRNAIQRLVAGQERTLLWLYAAGLITDDGMSLPAMEALTGIQAGSDDCAWPCKAVSYITGDRITYGTDARVAPWLFGRDPDCEVFGWTRGLCGGVAWHAPALMEKRLDGWRSVWSSVPGLPAAALREIAQRAGVHIYAGNGDQVLAAGDLLAVHAARDGRRRVRLPRPLTVADAFTGAVVSRNRDDIEVDMRGGTTRVWRLHDEPMEIRSA